MTESGVSETAPMERGAHRRTDRRIASAVAVSAVVLAGCASSASGAQAASSRHSAAARPVVQEKMVIETGKMDGKPGWPKFSPSNLTFPAGADVALTIVSYDDGTAPLPPGSPYGHVWGSDPTYGVVSGGTETVDGKAVTKIANDQISHTFTVPKLLLNIPIPAVQPGHKTVTVTFRFRVDKAGTYSWLCVAPCGSGSMGMGGAMEGDGWMRGVVNVT